jgi:hypothetical protein
MRLLNNRHAGRLSVSSFLLSLGLVTYCLAYVGLQRSLRRFPYDTWLETFKAKKLALARTPPPWVGPSAGFQGEHHAEQEEGDTTG